ncbi:MAG: lamin tail domain-containing protein [Planctomycetes bacterium]|nr:lamin tail domain-containing protein [Planctomycetota bacterium]
MWKLTRVFVASCLLSACAGQEPKQFTYLSNTPVRITELHVDPSAQQGKVEFIEIANTSKSRVDLSGWSVSGAGRKSLPTGTTLASGDALVVCQNMADFRRTFARAPKPVAELSGKLRNRGEIVRLEDPQGRIADEVDYDLRDVALEKAKGGGWSLHRLRVRTEPIWGAGKPTPGEFRSKISSDNSPKRTSKKKKKKKKKKKRRKPKKKDEESLDNK